MGEGRGKGREMGNGRRGGKEAMMEKVERRFFLHQATIDSFVKLNPSTILFYPFPLLFSIPSYNTPLPLFNTL
jgi:hypothetical protein